MQLKETSFMNDSNSQNAKGFQNPPQQKIQRENKIRRMSYWKASESWKEPKYVQWCYGMGGTYPLAHFLGNFREKTKKVPTRTVSRKLSEISLRFPKKFIALLPLAHFSKSCDELSLYNRGGQIMPHIGLKKEVFLSFF